MLAARGGVGDCGAGDCGVGDCGVGDCGVGDGIGHTSRSTPQVLYTLAFKLGLVVNGISLNRDPAQQPSD